MPLVWTSKMAFRLARSGSGTCSCTSKRPGRMSAASSMSALFVAASTTTPVECSRLSCQSAARRFYPAEAQGIASVTGRTLGMESRVWPPSWSFARMSASSALPKRLPVADSRPSISVRRVESRRALASWPP